MTDLSCAALSKAFGDRPILRGIDMVVASGSLLAILGPSGSGKTTLLRLICGFERSDGGTIRIGRDLVSGNGLHVSPEQRNVGYVAQDGALFPHLSVAKNIAFGLPRMERRKGYRVGELLDLVGLKQRYSARPPQELSGGEQQRVALARALAPRPRLVLLDEPFSSLDAGLRVETRLAVSNALRQTGATAVLVTHDQSEALSLGDQAAVMLDGQIVQIGAPETLYRRPVNAAVARFVGDANLVPGEASDGLVRCCLGLLNLAPAMPQGCVEALIRPEQVRLVPLAAESAMPAIVTGITYYGHDAVIRLTMCRSDIAGTRNMMARIHGHAMLAVGQEIGVSVEGVVVTFPRSSPD